MLKEGSREMPPKKRPCFQEVEFGHQQKGSVNCLFDCCDFAMQKQSLNYMKSYELM